MVPADREATHRSDCDALLSGRNTVLTITGCPVSIMDGGDIATQLAAIATAKPITDAIGGLVLTGGDIAASGL